MEFSSVKPSGVIPVGRTVKASTNIQLERIALVKSVNCEHGDRMDQFAPAPATCPVTQVGRIISHQYAA